MQSQLTISDLSLRYDSGVQVGPLSLELMPGEVTLIAGASGAGKSTLARLCTGILEPTQGTRRLDGVTLEPGIHRELQFVFQNPFEALNPTRRIGSTVEAPLRNFHGLSAEEAARESQVLAKTLELEPWTTMSQRFPHQLSGGQRQRVLLARALAARPKFIFADEPTAMLDQSLKQGVYSLLRNLAKEFGVGVIMITHDLLGAEPFADRIIVMDSGSVVDDFPQNQTSIKLSPVALTLVQAALFRSPRAGEQNDIQ